MLTKVKSSVQAEFDGYISQFPNLEVEIRGIAQKLRGNMQVLFMKAVTQLTATDIISIDINELLNHVKGVFNALNSMSYCRKLTADLIFDYVLPFRVNDEAFCHYNDTIYKELFGFVKGKRLRQAALEVNYWCYSKATYAQADDRTQNALATINVGKGRCGEESVLAVSAFRSVGIPARQVYSPYWSHCDDNHAWVEVFTGEDWEFMGACEPSEQFNTGWFNYAASKCGVVRHRLFKNANRKTICADENNAFTTEFSTSKYGETKNLKVKLILENKPVSKALVGIFVINYAMPKLICQKLSNEKGEVDFELGKGDFIVMAEKDGLLAVKLCKSEQEEIELSLSKELPSLQYEIEAPKGKMPPNEAKISQEHKFRMDRLKKRRFTLKKQEESLFSEYLYHSGKNKEEISKFIKDKKLSEAEKKMILNGLTQKDFADVSYDVLMDCALNLACDFDKLSEIFKEYLLKIRVKDEYLYPHRAFVKEFFKENTPKNPVEVYKYLKNAKIMDEMAYKGLIADLKGVLKHNITTSESLDINFVQLCRALGYPARLNPMDFTPEYYDGKDFVPVNKKDQKSPCLEILDKTQGKLKYGESYSISRLEKGSFELMKWKETEGKVPVFSLSKGIYVVTSAERQIDGSVIGEIYFVDCNEGAKEVTLNKIPDKTEEKLKNIPINPEIYRKDKKAIVAYIKSGNEPTEHILNEIWENRHQIIEKNIAVNLYSDTEKSSQILRELINSKLMVFHKAKFDENWEEMRTNMEIGDHRLPFVTAVKGGKCLYSFANYNVGTIGLILKLLEKF